MQTIIKTKVVEEYPHNAEESLDALDKYSHTLWNIEFAKNVCEIWGVEYDSALEITLKNQPNTFKGMSVHPDDEGKQAVPNYWLAEWLANQLLGVHFDDKGLTGKGFISSNSVKQIKEKVVYTND